MAINQGTFSHKRYSVAGDVSVYLSSKDHFLAARKMGEISPIW